MSEPCRLRRGEGYGACVDEGAQPLLPPLRTGAAGVLDDGDQVGTHVAQEGDGVHRLQGGELLGDHHQGVLRHMDGDVLTGLDVAGFHRLGGDEDRVLLIHDVFLQRKLILGR